MKKKKNMGKSVRNERAGEGQVQLEDVFKKDIYEDIK
jgi:hypothetical protein